MSKITQVEPQKRSASWRIKRFNVFLDGVFAFGADEDLVVEHRLVPGKQLTPQDVEKLLFEAEVGKLMEKMYRLWNIRPRSEKEVRDKLRIKNYELRIKRKEQISDLAIELTIKKLKEKGLLNDEQFARSWIEARSKKKGKLLIKQELIQKGISREIIEKILNDSNHLSRLDELRVAEKLIEKKMKVWKNLNSLELKKKAYEYLLRRGFEYEVVNDVIEKFIKNDYNDARESD